MPLTFPSHAAAVWPLHWLAPRVLPAAALIVGSCTPDFAYLIGFSGLFTHSLAGTVFLQPSFWAVGPHLARALCPLAAPSDAPAPRPPTGRTLTQLVFSPLAAAVGANSTRALVGSAHPFTVGRFHPPHPLAGACALPRADGGAAFELGRNSARQPAPACFDCGGPGTDGAVAGSRAAGGDGRNCRHRPTSPSHPAARNHSRRCVQRALRRARHRQYLGAVLGLRKRRLVRRNGMVRVQSDAATSFAPTLW